MLAIRFRRTLYFLSYLNRHLSSMFPVPATAPSLDVSTSLILQSLAIKFLTAISISPQNLILQLF
jgi:hypothetical protein